MKIMCCLSPELLIHCLQQMGALNLLSGEWLKNSTEMQNFAQTLFPHWMRAKKVYTMRSRFRRFKITYLVTDVCLLNVFF